MDTANAKRLMIFIDDNDRSGNRKLSEAIVESLLNQGIAGATVLRGIEGYGVHSEVHKASLMNINSKAPLIVIAIDQADKIDKARLALNDLVEEGLLVVDSVHVDRKTRK